MSVKLSCSAHTALDTDLVECAQKCCDAYIKFSEEGLHLDEYVQVIGNIQFARDVILEHGAQWYIENCDPMNTFGHVLGLKKTELTASAAQEGLASAIFEFIAKIFSWILACFGYNTNACAKNESNLSTIIKKTNEIKQEAADPGRIQKSGESKQDYYRRRFKETKIRPLYFKVWSTLFSEHTHYNDAKVVSNDVKYKWETDYDHNYDFYAIKYKNLSSIATSMTGLVSVIGPVLGPMTKFAEECEKLVKEGSNSSTSVQSESGAKEATEASWSKLYLEKNKIWDKVELVYKGLISGCTQMTSSKRDTDARISLSDFGFDSEQDILDLPRGCKLWVDMANSAKNELSKYKGTAERLSKLKDTGYEKNSESYKYLRYIGGDIKDVIHVVESAIAISVKCTDYLRDVVTRFGDIPDANPKQLT